MKTYTTPITTSMDVHACFAICDPSAGRGSSTDPNNPSGSGSNAAPQRLSTLYV